MAKFVAKRTAKNPDLGLFGLPHIRWNARRLFLQIDVPRGWSLGRFSYELEDACLRHVDELRKNVNISPASLLAWVRTIKGRRRYGELKS